MSEATDNPDSASGSPIHISTGDVSVDGPGMVAVGSDIVQTFNADPDLPYKVAGLANPYLGLRSFKYQDRAIFAGRETYVADALARLTAPSPTLPPTGGGEQLNPSTGGGEHHNLLFITGASGSGKSSFAQAGLIPALEDYYKGRGFSGRHAVIRPGAAPLLAMLDALAQLQLAQGVLLDPAQFGNAAALTQYLQAHTPARQVNLIILDQFEELFTLAPPDQRSLIFSLLESLPPFIECRTHIICTLRVDYLPPLFADKQLYDIAKAGIDLRVMSSDELKQAITKPVQQQPADKRLEPGLVERLAGEASADASLLPLLQVTLEELWDGGLLKLETYITHYGNLGFALQQRADAVYDFADYDGKKQQPRSSGEQQQMLAILLDLVQPPADDALNYVRIQRERSELAKGSAQRQQLIDALANARLLSLSAAPQGNDAEVDITHESLIQNWPRLQAAIKQQRTELERRDHFEEAKKEWLASGRKGDYLLTGIRLAEARELEQQGDIALQDAEAKELLRLSNEAQERQRQRQVRSQRLVIAGLSVLFIAALIAAAFALANGSEASRQRDTAIAAQATAQANAKLADSKQLAVTSSGAMAEGKVEAAMLLGYEAVARNENQLSGAALREAVDLSGVLSLTLDVVPSIAVASLPTPVPTPTSATAGPTSIPPTVIPIASSTSGDRDYEGVNSAVFSPDGNSILTAEGDSTAKLWSVSGKLLATFSGHSTEVTSAAFSPDGNTILTASRDNSANLWDSGGKLLLTLSDHTSTVKGVAFSRDGNFMLTASDDDTAKLWDKAGKLLTTLSGHSAAVNSAVFSPDGDMILTASADQTAKLWDKQGKLLTTLSGHSAAVNSAVFSPDGSTILTASSDYTFRRWDLQGKQLASVNSNSNILRSAVFSPDGKTILTAADDRSARLFDLAGNQLTIINGHNAGLNSAVFDATGNTVLTASIDGTARVWDVTGQPLAILRGHGDVIQSAMYSPDGNFVLTGSADGSARRWSKEGKLLTTYSTADDQINVGKFSPDGKNIVTLSVKGIARLWDVSGTQLAAIGSTESGVYNASFSPDSRYLITASPAGPASIWDMSGKLQSTITTSLSTVAPLAQFSPDGQYILTTNYDGNPSLWQRNGQLLTNFNGNTDLEISATFSRDSRYLLAVIVDGTAKLWDVSGQLLASFGSDIGNYVNSAVFSPDGKTILTGSNSGPAKLWDTQGHELASLSIGSETDAIFSPDGDYILTSANDYNSGVWTTQLWDKHGNNLALVSGQGFGFSPDSSRFLVAVNYNNDYRVHQYTVRRDDLLKLAACRVSRGLKAEELQLYGVDQPLFDFNKRVCPPPVSWEK